MNQNKQFSVVEKLFIIMAWKVNGMSQGAAYESWSDAYARKSAKEYWTDSTRLLQSWTFGIDDLQQVSSRDLKFLGFHQWDADDSMLLPLWLFPHMKKGEQWFGLNGEIRELNDEIDLDNRGGCLSIWFKHEPVPNIETVEALEDSRAGKVERITLDQMFNDGLGHYPDEIDPANGEGTFTEAQLNAEAEAWADDIYGGEDDEPVVHPFRDDEHQ